jgi:UDP-glucose 4-epimerase
VDGDRPVAQGRRQGLAEAGDESDLTIVRVAVTGASGFVGSALMPELLRRGHEAFAVGRETLALGGADAVVHLAGLAHRTGGRDVPSAAAFEAANAELPLRVFRAAREAGVARMIHVSTIAVLSRHEGVLREDMPLAPTTDYDHAKARAETLLLAEAGGPALTILRPPLVYGPGAKGNLRRLTRLCRLPLPLPFGGVDNRRSMVGLGNLVDALIFLLTQPVSGIVHVTDGHELSLRDLVTEIRAGLGRRPGLFSLPNWLLARIVPQRMARQLLADQRIEMAALPAAGWRPPHEPEHDLRRMAQG